MQIDQPWNHAEIFSSFLQNVAPRAHYIEINTPLLVAPLPADLPATATACLEFFDAYHSAYNYYDAEGDIILYLARQLPHLRRIRVTYAYVELFNEVGMAGLIIDERDFGFDSLWVHDAWSGASVWHCEEEHSTGVRHYPYDPNIFDIARRESESTGYAPHPLPNDPNIFDIAHHTSEPTGYAPHPLHIDYDDCRLFEDFSGITVL